MSSWNCELWHPDIIPSICIEQNKCTSSTCERENCIVIKIFNFSLFTVPLISNILQCLWTSPSHLPTLRVSVSHMSWPLTFSIHYIHPAQPKCTTSTVILRYIFKHLSLIHRWHYMINHLILCSECKMQVNVSAVLTCHVESWCRSR